jgi:phenylalanyl-tRNA synthetase alpha chain
MEEFVSIIDQLATIEQDALAALATISTSEAISEWKSNYLWQTRCYRQELSRELGTLPSDQRPAAGQCFNAVRVSSTQPFTSREATINQAAQQHAFGQDAVDVTLPGRLPVVGRLHPSTRVLRMITDIFADMGFQVWESPEVETDTLNFGLLNIPEDHPARDMWDTFYVETAPRRRKGLVAHPHLDPGEIHAMPPRAPNPVRVILPGKCYRYEQVTTRHEMMFHQVEGIAVGQHITFLEPQRDVDWLCRAFVWCRHQNALPPQLLPLYRAERRARRRVLFVQGRWLPYLQAERLARSPGAGMIHPTVLRNGGYDPDVYSGFAFGMLRADYHAPAWHR